MFFQLAKEVLFAKCQPFLKTSVFSTLGTTLMLDRSMFCKDPSSLPLIEMLGSNIRMTQKIIQKAKLYV